jgi:hypothetical protein
MSTRPTWRRECAGAWEAVRPFLEGLTLQDFGDLYVAPITTPRGLSAAIRLHARVRRSRMALHKQPRRPNPVFVQEWFLHKQRPWPYCAPPSKSALPSAGKGECSVPIILGCDREVKVLSIFQKKARDSH